MSYSDLFLGLGIGFGVGWLSLFTIIVFRFEPLQTNDQRSHEAQLIALSAAMKENELWTRAAINVGESDGKVVREYKRLQGENHD